MKPKLPYYLNNFTCSELVKLDTVIQKISKYKTPTEDYWNRIYIVFIINKLYIDLAQSSLEEII